MVTYNADAVVFAYFSFTFEVLSSGDLTWDYSLRTIDANVNTQGVLVFMETVAILCLAVNMFVKTVEIVDAFREFRATQYIFTLYNWLDWVGFIFQLRAWTTWLQFQEGIASINLANDGNFLVLETPNTRIRPFSTNAAEELRFLRFVDAVRVLTDQQVEYSSCQGIVVILYTFKVIKSLDFQPGIGLITRTLTTAGNNLVHYLLLFMFVFCGYSVAGNVMFGTQFADMSTLIRAFQTLTFMLMSFSSNNFYAQMQQAVKRDGAPGLEYTLFIWSFVCVGNLILLNILLAIIVEAYKKVALESEEASSMIEDIWGIIDYTVRRCFLPAHYFVSDDQLLTLAREELASIREKTSSGILTQLARSESSLLPEKAILLGGGVCMDKMQVTALAKRALESAAGIPRRSSVLDLLARREQSSGAQSLSGDPHIDSMVNNLMERYGDELEGKSEAIAREMQNLLALENQGRLLSLEARMSGLEESIQAVKGLLAHLVSSTVPATPVTPADSFLGGTSNPACRSPVSDASVFVTVVDARLLPRTDLLVECQAYCLVHIASSDGASRPNAENVRYHRTATAAGSNPVWGESFKLPLPPAARALVISVWDAGDDSMGDDLIGSAEAPLSGLQSTGEIWYQLNNPPLAARLHGTAVRLSFRLEEGVSASASSSTSAVGQATAAEIVFPCAWSDAEVSPKQQLARWTAAKNKSRKAFGREAADGTKVMKRRRWSEQRLQRPQDTEGSNGVRNGTDSE